mgnify:FL=1
MKEFLVVIPARYKSTRLPGKPLINIYGKTMIEWVYLRCKEVIQEENILIATDHIEIINKCKEKNLNYILTPTNCLTGTDRVCEVAKKVKAKYYINIQGDEPVFNSQDILLLISEVRKYNQYEVFGGYTAIKSKEDFFSVNIPKLVLNNIEELLYISRSSIPLNKANSFISANRQVCAYAFSYDGLINFSNTDKKTFLEEIEDIEILRFLESGIKVKMVKMSNKSISIDVKEDLKKLNKSMFYVR